MSRPQVKHATVKRGVVPDRRRPILIATLAVVVVAAIVAISLASRVPNAATSAPTYAHLDIGQPAPQFSVSSTAGPFDLKAAAGKPVVLEVFATWCPHCQRMVTIVNSLFDKFHDRVDFIAVSGHLTGMDGNSPETQADVIAFGEKFHVKYPLAFDPDLAVANKYLQGGFPTLIVIGKDQKIAYVASGEEQQGELESKINAALK